MKIGALVSYRDKPCMVLHVSGTGNMQIREYHQELGRIGSFTGPVEIVHQSDLMDLDSPLPQLLDNAEFHPAAFSPD